MSQNSPKKSGCQWYMKLMASVIIGAGLSQLPAQILLANHAKEGIVIGISAVTFFIFGIVTWFLLGLIKNKEPAPNSIDTPPSEKKDTSAVKHAQNDQCHLVRGTNGEAIGLWIMAIDLPKEGHKFLSLMIHLGIDKSTMANVAAGYYNIKDVEINGTLGKMVAWNILPKSGEEPPMPSFPSLF